MTVSVTFTHMRLLGFEPNLNAWKALVLPGYTTNANTPELRIEPRFGARQAPVLPLDYSSNKINIPII